MLEINLELRNLPFSDELSKIQILKWLWTLLFNKIQDY